MKGDKNTLKRIKDALVRVIKGTPERIPSDSILTVSTVEREAGMGNGTVSEEDPKAAAIPVLPQGSAASPDASGSELRNVTPRLESISAALGGSMSILFRPRGKPPILAADQDCAAASGDLQLPRKGDENPLKKLEDAAKRIIQGKAEHIPSEHKVSVTAVDRDFSPKGKPPIIATDRDCAAASGDLRRPMKGDQNTLSKLEAALKRIIEGNPEHIPPDRKLSVSAVEREAQMGKGSAYYYVELIQKIKKLKKQIQSGQEGAVPRSVTHRLEDERRKAAKYRKVVIELRERMSRMAADRHQEADALMQALNKIQNLQDELAESRRETITLIKPSTMDPK